MEFKVGDVVVARGHDEYLEVTAVIGDRFKLLVACSTKQEFEVPFKDVFAQYVRKYDY